MKRLVLVTLVAACSDKADIGVNGQPVTCQPNADGAANGTVTNATTQKSFTFGAVATTDASVPNQETAVRLRDDAQALQVDLAFSCGLAVALGTYDVGAGQTACPFLANAIVSGDQQQVFGNGKSGVVIVDQNVGCLAGRYDVQFHVALDNQTFADEGEVAGWFSVPLP